MLVTKYFRMIPFFHVVHKYLLTWAHFLQSIFITRKKLKPNKQLIEVLHQNDNYLVVNKPYDLLINSDESDKEVNISTDSLWTKIT